MSALRAVDISNCDSAQRKAHQEQSNGTYFILPRAIISWLIIRHSSESSSSRHFSVTSLINLFISSIKYCLISCWSVIATKSVDQSEGSIFNVAHNDAEIILNWRASVSFSINSPLALRVSISAEQPYKLRVLFDYKLIYPGHPMLQNYHRINLQANHQKSFLLAMNRH